MHLTFTRLHRSRLLVYALLLFAALNLSGAQAQEAVGKLTPETYKTLQFRAIGPAIMGGRIDDFAVVESNPHIVYAATASGGLWKTVNNGVTWEPLFDEQPVSSIGDVTVAPSNPDIVWVGTGEANNRQSSSWGNGIYKSTDGGKTWEHLGLNDTHHIGRIAIHPQNPDIVYVAAAGHLWGANKERGLYKTTDGGKTWTNTKFINEDTGFNDLAMDLREPDTLYAAAYQRRRTPSGFHGGGPGGGLFKTTDGGATWTKLSNGLPTGDAGRIGIDVYRKDPQTVYLTYEHTTESGVYRSDDKGATWKKMSAINPRPMYYSQIRVDPNNEQRVYVLGASWYVSDNGGRSFAANPLMRIHGDYHALWINPANSNHLLNGSDGGIHYSYDKGKTWDYVNTIPLGQFYEVGYDMRKPYWVYGGLQDNGSWGAPVATLNLTGPSNDEWMRVGGGDGFYAQVDPKDHTTVYVESQNGNIQRLNLATTETKSIRPQPPDNEPRYRFDWDSPIVISPHNNRRIYLGGHRLFISNDRGDTWERTPDLTKNIDRNKLPIMGVIPKANLLSGHDGQDNYSQIVTVSESPVKAGVLWVGTDDGNVQVSRDDGRTWQNVIDKISGVPAHTYVTRVVASAAKEGRAYVTFDGHRNDDFKPYVFVTEDFGASWQTITNNLPHPANVIREHPRNPNLLLVGTEFGVFISFNRGAAWLPLKNNLPTVPVDDIQIHPRENDLILATHGRSIWVLDDMTALEQMNETVAAAEAQLFDIRPATMWRLYNHKGSTGHKTFIANNPPYGAIIGYYLREKAKEAPKLTITDKSGAVVRELTAPNEPGVQRVTWDLRYAAPITAPGTMGDRAPNAALGLQGQGQGQPSAGMAGGAGAGFGGFGLARAPRVLPGEYTVKLSVNGQTFSKTVKVEEDPRIQLAPAEQQARVQTLLAINKLQKAAFDANRTLQGLRQQLSGLQDALKKQVATPEAVTNSVNALLQQINDLSRRIQPSGGRFGGDPSQQESAGPSDLAMQNALLLRLGQVFSALDNYTEAPTARQREQIERLSAQLKELIGQTNQIITESVPNLNRQIAESGATPIKAGEPLAPLQ